MPKLPSLKFLVALMIGIILYDAVPLILGVYPVIFIFAGSLVAFVYPKFRYILILVFISLGFQSQVYFDVKNAENFFGHKKNTKKLIVLINGSTEEKAKTYKVEAEVMSVHDGNKWHKTSGKILLYFDKQMGIFPKVNQVVVLKNKYREIEAPKNPYEFDYKQYQARKNIHFHQFLRQNDAKIVGKYQGNFLIEYAERCRNYAHSVFATHLPSSKELSIADAIISGQQADVDFETKQWYSKTGTIHILAVSGMHVAILLVMLKLIFEKTLKLSPGYCLIIIVTLLWIYAVFTGMSASACRATMMFSLIQLGDYLRKQNETLNTLMVSALVLLLFRPTWIYDVGFQLSYMAVIGIILINPILVSLRSFSFYPFKWLWEVSCVTISATGFTLPLSLFYFHQFPNYFLVANPTASLLSSLTLPTGILLLFVSSVPFLGPILGGFLQIQIKWLNVAMAYLSEIPGALSTGINLHLAELLALLLTLYFLVVWLKSKSFKALYSILLLLTGIGLSSFYKNYNTRNQQELTYHYIPRGWGISIIDGHSATFISSDTLINNPLTYQYHLKNYYDSRQVRKVNYLKVKDSSSFVVQHPKYKIARLGSKNFNRDLLQYPQLLVSNNALRYFKQDIGSSVILDGTNYKSTVETNKIKSTIVLYETGSLSL